MVGEETEADQETIGEGLSPSQAEENPGQANEAMTEVEEPTTKIPVNWEWVVIICALVIGMVMICVRLLYQVEV